MLEMLGRANTRLGLQVELEALDHAIEASQLEPASYVSTLGTTAQSLLGKGNKNEAARARYWAGRAAELATERGDTRFGVYARFNYELALEVIEDGAQSEFEADIRVRLQRLTSV